MQLSLTSSGDVLLKEKGVEVTLGTSVRIGSYEVPGAGEFEVETVPCTVEVADEQFAYFLVVDGVHVTYLDPAVAGVSDLSDASSTEVLVVRLRGDESKELLTTLVKKLEPGFLVLTGSSAEELGSTLGLTPEPGNVLKVSRTSLPEEGTRLFLGA